MRVVGMHKPMPGGLSLFYQEIRLSYSFLLPPRLMSSRHSCSGMFAWFHHQAAGLPFSFGRLHVNNVVKKPGFAFFILLFRVGCSWMICLTIIAPLRAQSAQMRVRPLATNHGRMWSDPSHQRALSAVYHRSPSVDRSYFLFNLVKD
jgi:hypothetical protein